MLNQPFERCSLREYNALVKSLIVNIDGFLTN